MRRGGTTREASTLAPTMTDGLSLSCSPLSCCLPLVSALHPNPLILRSGIAFGDLSQTMLREDSPLYGAF
jgi:hypothetical protein